MPDIAEQIVAWEKAGLIDAATADRLRATLPTGTSAEAPSPTRHSTSFDDSFGPSVQVAEAFTYLGVGFLASAWTAFLSSTAGSGDESRTTFMLGSAVSALAFAAIALYLRRGDARRRRGAGIASLVSTAYAASAFWFGLDLLAGDTAFVAVVASLGSLLVALAFRWIHPSLLTQFGALAAGTAFAAATLSLLRDSAFGSSFDQSGEFTADPNAIVEVVLEAIWWIVVAVVFGLIGLRESRAVDDPGGPRRAGLTRLWAALTLVIGVAVAVTRSGPRSETDYGRLLEPFVGDVLLVVISVVLVERAFRRGSGAFLVGGALALIIALSDFNASYLTDTVQGALLVEGVILLAIGYGANRLRTQLDARRRAAAPTADEPVGT